MASPIQSSMFNVPTAQTLNRAEGATLNLEH
jgi:hypothetical protein